MGGERMDTKSRIIQEAEQLFVEKGYENVSVRAIAKASGCSHTAIYLYFKDKKELLNEIAQAPISILHHQLKEIMMMDKNRSDKLHELLRMYITFGLNHKDVYQLLITVDSINVESTPTDDPLNEKRIQLFNLMKDVMSLYGLEDQLLSLTRLTFFQMHGIVMTYIHSKEEVEQILARIEPSLDLFVRSLEGLR